jgi:hypothetical protein
MKQYFSPELATEIEKTIAITLRGDIPENKLLGIQFGKTSN